MDNTGGGDSVLLSLLTARAERKDTRVFAHATAETQVAITDNYGNRPVTRSANLVFNTQEPGFLEVFPRVASRPPRLLQELEAMMVDRLRTADKAASVEVLLPKDRDPRMAANLSLDAHRQVFAAFVHGFSTYTSLLSRVQAEFEYALAEGLRCAAENVEVRLRLAAEADRREQAEQEVRSKIMAREVEFRRQAFAKLQETRERTQRLVKRAAAAEKDLKEMRAEEARLKGVVSSLAATSAKLAAQAAKDAAWAEKPTSARIGSMRVGPLTAEDQLFLDQEYTGSVNTTQAVAGRSGATSGPAASTSTGGQARGSPSPTHGPPLEAESTEELGPVPSTGL